MVEDVLEGVVPEDVLDSRAVEGRVVVEGVLEGRAMEGRAVEGRGGSTDLGRILRSTVHRRIPAAILARQGSLKEAHVKLGLVARLHHTGVSFNLSPLGRSRTSYFTPKLVKNTGSLFFLSLRVLNKNHEYCDSCPF